jgi:hypothetical protein
LFKERRPSSFRKIRYVVWLRVAPYKTTASGARRMRGLVRALDPPLRLEDLHSGEKMSYLERIPLPKCSQASSKGPWTGFQDEDDPGAFTPDSLDYTTPVPLGA